MAWNRMAPWDPESDSLLTYANTRLNRYLGYTHNKVWDGDRYVMPEWRPADEPFFAVLRFTGFSRGRSAARAIFTINGRGGTVAMFLRDLSEMVRAGYFFKESMDGHWIVVKRGENYGVRLAALNAKKKKNK